MKFPESLAKSAQELGFFMDGLLNQVSARAPRLMAAMRYASLGPGKRLRPFFVLETAGLFDVPAAAALRTAAALEFVHCYSLVHDDLPAMDDDDLRRGRPTVHRAFDEATAILAGDSLLTYAFEVLAGPETHADAAVRCELILALARASGRDGMAGGQMLDLGGQANLGHDEAKILAMQAMKTGALFGFACEAGAILGGASAQDRAHLSAYASKAGLAFQIADDLLDVEAAAAELGKATAKDAARGKATFLTLYGLEGARRRCQDLTAEAIATLAPFGAKAELLVEAARYIAGRRS